MVSQETIAVNIVAANNATLDPKKLSGLLLPPHSPGIYSMSRGGGRQQILLQIQDEEEA